MVPRSVACVVMDYDDCLRGDGIRLRADATDPDAEYPAGQ